MDIDAKTTIIQAQVEAIIENDIRISDDSTVEEVVFTESQITITTNLILESGEKVPIVTVVQLK